MTARPRESRDVATHFTAMASPCLVLVDTKDSSLGAEVGQIAKREALRIEAKFTRYRPSVMTHINASAGKRTEVDDETADLLDYAAECHRLSAGRFDITSGVLRRVWRFDGTGRVPDPDAVREVMRHVGWQKLSWERPHLELAPGMEIDFGGIGKEYAVDRAIRLVRAHTEAPVLVNFGGDLCVSGPRSDGDAWYVAIEDVERAGAATALLEIKCGAIATSGDAHRHIDHAGVRYGHVLDPNTGWPIADAPRSVTVHANTCTEAGLLAKLALLRGKDAEAFLRAECVRSWCVR